MKLGLYKKKNRWNDNIVTIFMVVSGLFFILKQNKIGEIRFPPKCIFW